MTSNIKIQNNLKESDMPEAIEELGIMKKLVGTRVTRKYDFMGSKITISKLTVNEVSEIQKEGASSGEDPKSGLNLLKKIINISVPESAELTQEDFDEFPFDELSKLSKEIMKYSGMDIPEGNG